MKRAIIGYVTGLVNSSMRAMAYYKESIDNARAEDCKDFINELQDLLDFIEDIPEEGQAKTVSDEASALAWATSCMAFKKRIFELEQRIYALKGKSKELEEYHSGFMEIFKQRGEKIQDLEREIKLLKRGITK